MDPNESLPEDDDLTVLEYVRHWIDAQFKFKERSAETVSEQVHIPESSAGVKPIFWIGLTLTVIGQILLGLERQSIPVAGLLVVLSGLICLWFGNPHEAAKRETLSPQNIEVITFHLKPIWLLATLAMAAVCFLLCTEQRFDWLQTLSWLTAMVCALYAFWPAKDSDQSEAKLDWKFWQNWQNDRVFIILVMIVAVLGLIFRLKDLAGLPPEIISAQVETYYSVSEIRQGANHILFSRNTVSEPLNYYWANMVALFSGRTLKIESIRLANSLTGLIGIGFIYALGKTIANRWVGLAAAGLAGLSFWPILYIVSPSFLWFLFWVASQGWIRTYYARSLQGIGSIYGSADESDVLFLLHL